MALSGNPYDGHTLETVIPDMEQTIGNELSRILADAGYHGHNAPDSHKFRVLPLARNAASPLPSSARCDGGQPSSPL
jgi:hypothetical protein